jgi:hypothetical protein
VSLIRVFVVYEQEPESDRYEQHVELCRNVPNAVFRHGKVTRTFAGEELAYYAEFEFADQNAYDNALKSDEFRATGADAQAMGVPHRIYVTEVK